MYTFAEQNRRGKVVEEANELLFTEHIIPWGRNPYTGTSDPRRADYDHWLLSPTGILTEEKGNVAANETHNVAIEVDILEVSKAHFFFIAYVLNNTWGEQVIDRNDIYDILNATKLTHSGRIYKYKRVPAGQFGRPSALVPIPELRQRGVPVGNFLKQLAQQL